MHTAVDSETAGPTAMLAHWAAATGTSQLPPKVRHQVRRILADYLAAAFAGATSDTAMTVREYLLHSDHDRQATVIGTPERLSAAGAALANGTAAHALDLDDGYTPGACHPSAPICSAVLAAAEAGGSTGPEIVRAIALGYEIACRIAGATHPQQRRRGFHNTALVGTFGAMIGVASLHGASAEHMVAGIGNAASHAGGLLTFLDDGTELKRLHAGKAARDGLASAELAIAGLRGPARALESAHGYFAAFAGSVVDGEHLLGGLGDRWRMLDTYNKPYPCCRHVHGAIDAALALRDQHALNVEMIDAIDVATFAIAADHDRVDIHNTLDAQMSLPYSVAVALVHGDVGMEHFESAARADPAVQRLTRATTVRADPDLTVSYPANRPARVAISTSAGEVVGEIMQPYGEPANPMSDDDLDRKLRACAANVLTREHADRLSDWVWSFGDGAVPWELLAAPPTPEHR